MKRWMPLLLAGLVLWTACKPADRTRRLEGRVAGRAWSAELATVPEGRDADSDLAALGDSLRDWAARLAPEGEGSGIAAVNALAGSRSGSMDRATYDLLMRCFRYKKDSEGAVDFLAGPLHRIWGLRDADWSAPHPSLDRPWPADAAIDTALALVQDGGTFVVDLGVLLSLKGMEIDLEPVLEGVLTDHAARWLHGLGYPDLRVRIGDAARCAGEGPGRAAWSLELRSGDDGEPLGVFEPGARALVRMDAGHRALSLDGRSVGGAIDPRTGRPGGAVAAAWALAPDAERAEVWARTLWLDGEAALPLIEAQGGVAAAWLDTAGELHYLGDFPTLDDRP